MFPLREILVPVDFGESSDRAIDLAISLGEPFGARITLLHVMWLPGYFYEERTAGLAYPIDEVEARVSTALDESVERAKSMYAKIDRKLVTGEPWPQIVDVIEASRPDLVVMGAHGRHGVMRAFFHGVAEAVIRRSPVPILTTPAPPVDA